MQHDIFISYKRGPDEDRVGVLVGALRANGMSVWWDRDIPANAPWEETILEALHGAKICIVCWSTGAVASENVRSEARWAKERNKLLQIFVEKCEPPLFFGENQGLMLLDNSDLYGERFIAVRDAARALIGRVEAVGAAGNDGVTGGKGKRDALAEAWSKDEPAAKWEPSLFGISLSLFTLPFAAFMLLAFRTGSSDLLNNTFLQLLSTPLALGVATPAAAIVGGWTSYALLGRKPRRIGLFSGSFLALVAGIIASLFMFVVSGVAGQLLTTPGNPVVGFSVVAMFGVVAGPIIALFWLPIWLAWFRRWFLSAKLRTFVIIVGAFMPFALGAGSFALASADRNRAALFAIVDEAIYERGLALLEEVPEDRSQPLPESTIIRLQHRFGLPQTGQRSQQLSYAIRNLALKRDWVLAADGSGDATNVRDILRQSSGPIMIQVRPGVYSDADDDENLASARALVTADERPRPVFVRGEGPREEIIFEVRYVMLNPRSSISGVTIRTFDDEYPDIPIVRISGSAAFQNTVIQTTSNRPAVAVLGASTNDTPTEVLGLSEPRIGALIQDNLFVIAGGTGITITGGARADVIGNVFGTPHGFCLEVQSERVVWVRDNNMSACGPGRGIRASSFANVRVSRNVGVASAPTFVPAQGDQAEYSVY
jgi:hypothetical protein